ncbi:GFA family protein [Rhizobium sp. BK512]|uniref:GFA family protein n=1 Tax=Rhizobium sp. BK512 TaxID=2587010 RepID=UPI00160BA52C|nr:GFA family protein [Rhizobium sp. BK512]
MKRDAWCSCGQLSITSNGDPIKISACHCRECQRRTGSAFGVAVFFDREKVSASGTSNSYTRTGDSGKSIQFRFCPDCGSTVFWMPEFREDLVAVALGCFNDPSSLVPTQSVYEESRMSWVGLDLRVGG